MFIAFVIMAINMCLLVLNSEMKYIFIEIKILIVSFVTELKTNLQ